ncbi:MAG: tetratricopeptide repeat protein [Burkholderiaceae bacterium]|jgi:Flp pilus assembly protein TadD
MHTARGIGLCVRAGLLVAALAGGPACADDYAGVRQLMRNGQLADALTQAEQYLSSNPRDPQMRFLKALIQQDAGQQAEAIAAYTALTQEYPELSEPYNNLAVLHAAQGRYDQARAALEMAIRTNKDYAVAHENLGDVYLGLAGLSYGRALQLDAGNVGLLAKQSRLRQLALPQPR